LNTDSGVAADFGFVPILEEAFLREFMLACSHRLPERHAIGNGSRHFQKLAGVTNVVQSESFQSSEILENLRLANRGYFRELKFRSFYGNFEAPFAPCSMAHHEYPRASWQVEDLEMAVC